MDLIAFAVAILPPAHIATRAIELSAELPERDSQGLRLGGEVLPHITLTQQFVPVEDLEAALDRAGAPLTEFEPLSLRVTGADRNRSSVWMAIESTPRLVDLHRRLMDALRPFERQGGTRAAFVDGDARPGDVEWVAGFRETSSDAAFRPHITLGHAAALPRVEPAAFDATTVAACQLGKFCTFRRVLRRWELAARR